MRLYSFRDTSMPVGRNVPPGSTAGAAAALGHRVGRLRDDGTVEIDRADEAPAIVRPVAELTPAPAVPNPGKIVCIGWNYRDHLAEQGRPLPDRPTLFAKFSNAVIAHGEPIVRPPGTHALDLEAELGVVIAETARRVPRTDAWAHVAGYVVVNDVTARDWQGNAAALREGEHGDGQWLRAKGADTFLPMSSVFVSVDEIGDPSRLAVRSWRIPGSGPDAGREIAMQDGTTADMIFDIPALVEFVTGAITLEPGDVIATGTPSGVGVFRDPPIFLEPGDRVRVEVEGIGSVENPIVEWTDDRRPLDETVGG
jgi:2-keto-4-pentenoate hydratase/2-oxohepta-3-ene-1,7-dioic acid hydratase in catechol pathway